MQTSFYLPRDARTLDSPELSTGDESSHQKFTARDLPVAIDPLAFEIIGTTDPDEDSGRDPTGIMEIKVLTFPERELLGTAICRGIGRIERKRVGGVRLTKDFTLMIRTKEAFNPKASLSVAYLFRVESN